MLIVAYLLRLRQKGNYRNVIAIRRRRSGDLRYAGQLCKPGITTSLAPRDDAFIFIAGTFKTYEVLKTS